MVVLLILRDCCNGPIHQISSFLQSRQACETFNLSTRRLANGNYSADIILRTPLDFETVRSYILPVKAENTKLPRNFTIKNFVINVLDSQDQKPVFIRAPYSMRHYEEEPLVRFECQYLMQFCHIVKFNFYVISSKEMTPYLLYEPF